jgi:hypothetical protein
MGEGYGSFNKFPGSRKSAGIEYKNPPMDVWGRVSEEAERIVLGRKIDWNNNSKALALIKEILSDPEFKIGIKGVWDNQVQLGSFDSSDPEKQEVAWATRLAGVLEDKVAIKLKGRVYH